MSRTVDVSSRELRRGRRSAPGLAFARLLSREGRPPMEAVQWVRRDLVRVDAEGDPVVLVRDAEVPAEWSLGASLAMLERYGAVPATEAAGTSVRRVLEGVLEPLRARGMALRYFAREDDAATFCDEMAVLLLTQASAIEAVRADAAGWRWDAVERRPVRVGGDADEVAGAEAVRVEEIELPGRVGVPAAVVVPGGAMEALAEAAAAATAVESDEVKRLLRVAERMAKGEGPAVLFARGEGEAAPARSRCNATLQLSRFVGRQGELDVPALRHAVVLLTTAMELLVGVQTYATEQAAWDAQRGRPVGVGFCDLGGLLMGCGVGYDTPVGRRFAGAMASLVCAEALGQSARIAETCAAVREEETAADGSRVEVEDGACARFAVHREAILAGVRQQRAAAYRIARRMDGGSGEGAAPGAVVMGQTGLERQLPELVDGMRSAWDAALTDAERFGLRNCAVTALLPENGMMEEMDCTTAGLEPVELLLVEERRGGGAMRTRSAVAAGLYRLGYSEAESEAVRAEMERGVTLEAIKGLRAEDRAVFATRGGGGPQRVSVLGPEAVLRMLGAVAPFLSPSEPAEQQAQRVRLRGRVGAERIVTWMLEAWRSGAPGVRFEVAAARPERVTEPAGARAQGVGESTEEGTMERIEEARVAEPVQEKERGAAEAGPGAEIAGSGVRSVLEGASTLAAAEELVLRREQASLLEVQLQRIAELEVQVLSLRTAASESADAFDATKPPQSNRHRLPAERASMTHKFSIAGNEGYVTVGLYQDGSPGELFLRMNKESSTVAGLLDGFATTVSLGLQHGVPLRVLAQHFAEVRFEPAGETTNPQIPYARSVLDYVFRWLELRFLSGNQMDLFSGMRGVNAGEVSVPVTGSVTGASGSVTPRLGPVRRGGDAARG